MAVLWIRKASNAELSVRVEQNVRETIVLCM